MRSNDFLLRAEEEKIYTYSEGQEFLLYDFTQESFQPSCVLDGHSFGVWCVSKRREVTPSDIQFDETIGGVHGPAYTESFHAGVGRSRIEITHSAGLTLPVYNLIQVEIMR